MTTENSFAQILSQVRKASPLVHHITNYVTVNSCANITLAIGASPIMADAVEEAADIAAISSALVLNMGTLNSRTLKAMVLAGRCANKHNVPIVFDPVGAGASPFRNRAVHQILQEISPTVIKGNISEIRFICGLSSSTKGVDAAEADHTEDTAKIARALAAKQNCVVAVTGSTDVVSDKSRTVHIANGHPSLSCITGTGCMCASLAGACLGAAPSAPLHATVAAVATMGIAGELAHATAGNKGNGSFYTAILDAISKTNETVFLERANLYETCH